MIRRDYTRGWILITQYDHAVFAGSIMEHWGNELFSRPRPEEEVIFAVREHDFGWIKWDSSPKINPENGFPANFMEMESSDQTGIWSRSLESHSREHPYASALIALHFARFNNKLIGRDPSDENARRLEGEIGRFVSEKLGNDNTESGTGQLPEDIMINLRFVQVGDIISLALCHGWTSMELTDVPIDYEGASETLALKSEDGYNYRITPFPFSEDVLTLRISGRKLGRKTFSDDNNLRKEIGDAPYITLDFTIRKG
jgi:hypothetical protein